MTCEECGKEVNIGDFPFCPHEAVRPKPLFVPFEHEGKMVNSIQDANRIERETMRDYQQRGKGQPVVFRAFHQDDSNKDVNCFGRPAYEPPKKTRSVRVDRRG